MITFHVPGIPACQGSKRAVGRGRFSRIIEDDPEKHASWRSCVSAFARDAFHNQPLLEGPLTITVEFLFPKPKTLKKSEREQEPLYRATGPDLDKLCRSVGDALTGIVYRDDRQICRWVASRAFTSGPTGATITIEGAV